MDDVLLKDYLGLIHNGAIGAGVLARTLSELGPLSRIRRLPDADLRGAGFTSAQLAALLAPEPAPHCRGRVQADLAWAAVADRAILHFESPRYPALLRETASPPPLLFVEGDWRRLHSPSVAIVGSRRGSAYGRRYARWFAAELAKAGFVICSGMALGIDTAGHSGALDAGGDTVAVMGTGVDICYPARNRELRERIRGQGALLSEFPLGTVPIPANFPRRNRIISGLALGVLVIEAGLKSGSLVTAKLALQQNREIFAVPGPISSPLSRGCHQLLRQGATLVETPSDIVQELGAVVPEGDAAAESTVAPVSESAQNTNDAGLLALLDESGTLPELLARQAGLTQAELGARLLQLELAGAVFQQGGRYFPA